MKYDILIVGAGVVGASIAYSLIPYNVSVLLLDKNNDVAMGATRANSAIIHAGYDPKPGTLMARLNVEGNRHCGKLCEDLSVPFTRCGSLVLSFSSDPFLFLLTSAFSSRQISQEICQRLPSGIRMTSPGRTSRACPSRFRTMVSSQYL